MTALVSEIEGLQAQRDEWYRRAIDTLASEAYARPGGPIKTAIDCILIIEDNDSWRDDVEREVRKCVRQLQLHELKIMATRSCDETRAVARGLQEKGLLAICDLGLPQDQSEYARREFDSANGLELIRNLKALGARVIALTTQDAMASAFVNLSLPIDDFLLKSGMGWEQDLAERLAACLCPIDPGTLPLLVPTFDRRIRLGRVWIDLTPTQFEIVHALACAAVGRNPLSPSSFVQPLPVRESAPRDRHVPVSELQELMCRADLSGLDEHFMTSDVFRKAIASHLNSLCEVIEAAFGAVHLSIESKRLISRTRGGPHEEVAYRLRCAKVTVVDSPVHYRNRTASITRPYKILVVEDDPGWSSDIVNALTRTLPTDSVIVCASNYEEAVKAAEQLRPILATLDLNLPRRGRPHPNAGLALRRWLMEHIHGIGIIVLSSHENLDLQRDLSRPLRRGNPRTRLRDTDRLLKTDAEWLTKLRIRVLRLLKEFEAVLPTLPSAVHRVQVDVENLQMLQINGVQIGIPKTSNAERDLAILTLLASYDNQPLRRQAILDYWQEKGLLLDVGHSNESQGGYDNLAQQLTDRVEALRKWIEKSANVPGNEVIVGDKETYTLQGFVELTGVS